MPRPTLPRIVTFSIGPLTFREMGGLPGPQQGDANRALRDSLFRDWIGRIDPTRERWGLCGEDNTKVQARFGRWDAAVARNPDITWDEFEQSGESIESDLEEDPRKESFVLAAFRDDTPIGAVTFLNMNIETRTARKIEATAYVIPAFSVLRGEDAMAVYGSLYRWILSNEIAMSGGLALDIVELTFPVDIPEHRFIPAPENALDLLLGEIRDVDHDEQRAAIDSDAPFRIRRASAPRRIPVEDRV